MELEHVVETRNIWLKMDEMADMKWTWMKLKHRDETWRHYRHDYNGENMVTYMKQMKHTTRMKLHDMDDVVFLDEMITWMQ
jgi:hypothetical protein